MPSPNSSAEAYSAAFDPLAPQAPEVLNGATPIDPIRAASPCDRGLNPNHPAAPDPKVPALKASAPEALEDQTQQNTLLRILDRVRRYLELEPILDTVVTEFKALLRADRVVIYRFNADWSGEFIAEAVDDPWQSLRALQHQEPSIRANISHCSAQDLGTPRPSATDPTPEHLPPQPLPTDTLIQSTQGEFLAQGKVYRVCEDIYAANFSPCYLQVLERYQARAYIIVAVYHGQDLWGLLAAYQNQGPRQWTQREVQWMVHGATQLGVAVQQAELVTQLSQQTQLLQNTLKKLQWTQAQMVQGEKMASLGQLVAGIAHELNNPANFIAGNLRYVEQYMDDALALLQTYQRAYPEPVAAVQDHLAEVEFDFLQEDFPKTVQSMRVGTDRIHRLVKSLKNFSRLDESPQKQVDLHEGLDNTLLLLHHRLKAQVLNPPIALQKVYGELPLVDCYPSPLNQVFLNLITNSLDALEEWYGEAQRDRSPQIQIRTQVQEQTGQTWVAIAIEDNGPGIPSSLQTRIFDPFFTTKPPGKGTGLGLPISYQIITEMHHGQLRCVSTAGVGTTFWVEIPVRLSPPEK